MKHKIKILTQFSLTAALSFFVLDIFLSYTGISAPSKYEFGDKKVFQKLRSNNFILSQNEGFHMGKTNDYGYLGPSYKPAKGADVFRIALLGDSYVEGFQLFDDFHFRSVLERNLQKTVNKKVEALNFGRSGFDFHQMYSYYELFVKDFNPDAVLFFVSKNDFNPKTPDRHFKFTLSGDSIAIKRNFPDYERNLKWKVKRILDRSSLSSLLRGTVEIASTDQAPKILFDKLYFSKTKKSANNGRNKKREMPEELNTVSANILKTLANNPDSGKKFIIVYRTEAYPNYVKFIDSLNIPSIDLMPALLELKGKGIDPNYWTVTRSRGHWNHYGHKAVGETLTKELLRICEDQLRAAPEFKYAASPQKN